MTVRQIPLADLDFDERENQAVLNVLNSRWLSMGAVTQEFERQFAQACGVKYALGVSNATVALHLACLALGIGPGDEVIVPSLTFVATANAALYTGAEVRFADIIDPEEPTIDPADIDRLVTPRTKAVIVMHYGGYPCRMAEVRAAAERNGLKVIEDAAHAPGAKLDGKALGAWGDAGCFSFFSNKNLSTGEGGMVITDNPEIAERVRTLRSHGMTSLTWDRHKGHAYTYDVVDLGYNYRLDEIRSALGLVQLDKLANNNARRSVVTQRYWRELEGGRLQKDACLRLPFCRVTDQPNVEPAYHIFPALLPQGADRLKFIQNLREAGVQTSIHYPPIHTFSFYRKRYPGVRLPKTEDFASREVTLPLYPTIDDEAIEIVVQTTLRSLYGN